MRKRIAAVMAASGMVLALSPGLAFAAGKPADRAPGVSLDRYYQQAVQWRDCEFGTPEILCATVKVPLDYRKPAGPTIDIAISRIAAPDPRKRRGSMLFNPGGPGGPGLNLPLALKDGLPKEVVQQYDLIGFDPRFVGASTPITCKLGLDEQNTLMFPSKEGLQADAAYMKNIADKCGANAADKLPYASTRNVARDMDVIRGALGDRKISYLGYSYGTYLGTVYTQMFPQRSDRFILDSNVDANRAWREVQRLWGPAAEIAIGRWAKWAARFDDTYQFGGTARAVRATFDDLVARINAKPIEVKDPDTGEVFTVTGDDVKFITFSFLYDDAAYPALASFITEVLALEEGGGSAEPATVSKKTAKLVKTRLGKAGPGDEPGEDVDDNFAAAFLAYFCGDAAWPSNPAVYQRDSVSDAKRFPMMGGAAAYLTPCTFWPVKPSEPAVKVAPSKANVLLVQSTGDIATPYEGAVRLRKALGSKSRLVSVEGAVHGVYPFYNNFCANTAATQYLLSGKLPRKDLACGKIETRTVARSAKAAKAAKQFREMIARQPL
jgi:pimeloyl-ACP methyl ester carboxylesterase